MAASDPNLTRGTIVTVNISDGTGATTTSPTGTATTTPGAPTTSPGAPTEPVPAPNPPVDLDELGRQFGDVADGIQSLFNN